jgi:hypothetical protein
MVNDVVHCSVLDGAGDVKISGSSILTVDTYTGYGKTLEFPATFSDFDHSDIWLPMEGEAEGSAFDDRRVLIGLEMSGYNIVCVCECPTLRGCSMLKLILFERVELSLEFADNVSDYYLDNDVAVPIEYQSFFNVHNCCVGVTVCWLGREEGDRLLPNMLEGSSVSFWMWEGMYVYTELEDTF